MGDEKLRGRSAEASAEDHAAHGEAERSRQQADTSGRKFHPHKLGICDNRASDQGQQQL